MITMHFIHSWGDRQLRFQRYGAGPGQKKSLQSYIFFKNRIQIFQVGPTHRLKRDAELEKPVAMTGNDPPQYIVEHDGNYLFVVHIEGKQFFESQGFYMKYYTAL